MNTHAKNALVYIFVKHLYICNAFESWTMTEELEKQTQAFDMRCFQIIRKISYKDHAINEDVHRKSQSATEKYDELLTLVK